MVFELLQLCNFVVVKLTPIALERIGWKVYVIFALLNLAWLPVIALFLPETKGLTLEQVDELFATDDWRLELESTSRALTQEETPI